MKSLIQIICPFILFSSCNEVIDIDTEFKNIYSLNCIIKVDTSFQTATILKAYPPGMSDSDSIDFYNAKQIQLWVENRKVYFFRDSVLKIQSNKGINIHYINNFSAISGDSLKIRAVLQSDILTAETKIPDSIHWNYSESDSIIKMDGPPYYTFKWFGENSQTMYHIKLSIIYRKNSDHLSIRKKYEVPLQYHDDTKIKYPLPIRSNGIKYSKESFNLAMEEISKEDSVKNNYIIYGALLEILIFDANLSTYYRNSLGYFDDYTIRVDQSDFSNIVGGFGIFGSYLEQHRSVKIDEDYIRSLGCTGSAEKGISAKLFKVRFFRHRTMINKDKYSGKIAPPTK